MKLRTKLLIATTATAMTVLGISEWFGYQHTIGFLEGHAALMEHSSGTGGAVAFRRNLEAFASRLVALHVLHAAAQVAALVLVLSLFWSRLVLKPLRALLEQINRIEDAPGGSTIAGTPATDEFRRMFLEVDQLGDRLTSALHEAQAATELSTTALLARTAVRKMEVAQDQLASALTAIASAERRHEAPPEKAVRSLESVLHRLSTISREFGSVPDQGLTLAGDTPRQDNKPSVLAVP